MSYRAISEATGIGKTFAAEYVHRASVVGITWPVPENVDDVELDQAVGLTFADEPLTSPLVHRGFTDIEACGHFAGGEHTAVAQSLVAAARNRLAGLSEALRFVGAC